MSRLAFGHWLRWSWGYRGLFDYYWRPASTRKRDFTNELTAEQPSFDAGFFQKIANDLLTHPLPEGPDCYHGPVSHLDTDFAIWQRRFPNAEGVLIDSGHFIQLESDDNQWWQTP